MKAVMKLASPDEVEATISITMQLGAWRNFRNRLDKKFYPEWKLADVIYELVTAAETKFYPAEKAAGEAENKAVAP